MATRKNCLATVEHIPLKAYLRSEKKNAVADANEPMTAKEASIAAGNKALDLLVKEHAANTELIRSKVNKKYQTPTYAEEKPLVTEAPKAKQSKPEEAPIEAAAPTEQDRIAARLEDLRTTPGGTAQEQALRNQELRQLKARLTEINKAAEAPPVSKEEAARLGRQREQQRKASVLAAQAAALPRSVEETGGMPVQVREKPQTKAPKKAELRDYKNKTPATATEALARIAELKEPMLRSHAEVIANRNERRALETTLKGAQEGAAAATTARYSKTADTETPGMTKEAVQAVVDAVRKQWKTLPGVDIASRELMEDKTIKGRYATVEGKPRIGLVHENLKSAEDVIATLYHEGLGHFGLAKKFKDGLDGLLESIYKANPAMRKAADAWLERNPDAYKDENRPARATEEVLAGGSELGPAKQNAWNRVAAFVRGIGRKMGWVKEYTDNDVLAVLRQAHEAAMEGGAARVEHTPDRFSKVAAISIADRQLWDAMGSKLVPEDKINPSEFIKKDYIKGKLKDLQAKVEDKNAHLTAIVKHGLETGALTKRDEVQNYWVLQSLKTMGATIKNTLNNGVAELTPVGKNGAKLWLTPDENAQKANFYHALKTLGGENLRDFAAYVRVVHYDKVGWDKAGLGAADIIDAKRLAPRIRALGDANPKFVSARTEIGEMNKALVKMLVDSGRITPEEAATWHPETYTPSYREKDGVMFLDGGAKPIRIGNIKDMPQLHELLGGKKQLMPYVDGVVRNIQTITHMSMTNYAMKNTAHILADLKLGHITQANPNERATSINFFEKGVARTVRMDKELGKEQAQAMLAKAKTPAQRARAQALLKFHKEVDYISIPNLISNLSGTIVTIPAALNFLRMPAQLLHAGITRNPLYPLRQLPRDMLNAWQLGGMQTKDLLGVIPHMMSTLRGTNEHTQALRRAGVGEGNIITGGPQDAARALTKLHAAQDGGAKGMLNTMAFLADRWATSGDLTVKGQLYKTGLEKGMDEAEALRYAIEAGTNFSTRGSSAGLYLANMMTPFINSQIRGLSVAVRSMAGMAEGQEKTQAFQHLLVRGGMLAAASVAYHSLLSDEDWYQKLSPAEKVQNYFYKTPDMKEPLKFPIQFESGMLVHALPEMLSMLFENKNGVGYKDFQSALNSQIISNIFPGGGFILNASDNVKIPIPTFGAPGTALAPVFNILSNYNTQLGAPIIPKSLEKLDPSEQYTEKTSAFAKVLGAKLGIAPLQIDYAINSYTSNLGVAVAHALVSAVETPREGVSPPTPLMSSNKMIGTYFGNLGRDSTVNTFHPIVIDAPLRAEATIKELMDKKLDPKAAEAYAMDHPEYMLADDARQLQKDLSDLHTERVTISNVPDRVMNAVQKRAALDELNNRETLIGKQMVKLNTAFEKFKSEQTARQSSR